MSFWNCPYMLVNEFTTTKKRKAMNKKYAYGLIRRQMKKHTKESGKYKLQNLLIKNVILEQRRQRNSGKGFSKRKLKLYPQYY